MKIVSSLLLSAGLLATLPASAQFQKPEDAIKYRKSALTVMGTHFSRIGAMAQGRVPFDAAAAAANAADLAPSCPLRTPPGLKPLSAPLPNSAR